MSANSGKDSQRQERLSAAEASRGQGPAAGLARRLGAHRQGRNWRCACPCECGYSLSLTNGEGGRLLAHCFGGCEFDQIMLALVEYGLLDDDGAELDAPPGGQAIPGRDDAVRRRNKIQHAREIYAGGVWDERIQVYLRSRGITLTSRVLRFAEQAPHRLGARLPAMLAPVVDVNGEQIGVHMTYLKLDGGGKADLSPKDLQRECRGVIGGGAIRLMNHDPGVELVVAEGVETALSAAEIFSLPAWTMGSAGGLKTVELPPEARRVLIAADHDEAGRQCALAARDRWAAEGRAVRVKVPPVPGHDFNDVLLGRRRDVGF
jgi:hypothetical protein